MARNELSLLTGMMNRLFIVFLLAACSVALAKGERVAGAELVEQATSVEPILNDLLEERLEKREIDLLIENAEPILKWASKNVDLWQAPSESDEPLVAIRSLAVWDRVEMTASEFVATIAKLMFLRQYLDDPEELKALKSEIRQMEKVVAGEKLSPFVLERAKVSIAEKRRLVDLLEGSMRRNVKLYKANQERIDPVINRFERIGE